MTAQNVPSSFISDCTCMPIVHSLSFLGCAVKPCTEGVHVHSEMDVAGTFWGSDNCLP